MAQIRMVQVAWKFNHFRELYGDFDRNLHWQSVQKLNSYLRLLVLNVGANLCQLATDLFPYGFKGDLFSAEPSSNSFNSAM